MKKENLEVLLEDISSKFDLVLEGHEVLRSEVRELGRKTDERFDLVDFKIDTLNKKIDAVDEKLSKKIDAVATDLAAHRADTEAHHGMYRVKEG
jgi:3-dehydroquinate dehydratase